MKKWLLFILLLVAVNAFGQASVSLSPVAKQQFFSATGIPLAGGKLYTYRAGTTTPQATYVDATGTAVNTNPIILDSGGFANIWIVNQQQYKFVLYDANNVLQWSVDNFSTASGGSSSTCPPGSVPDTSVLFVHPLGTCDGVTKFKTNESGQVDINTGGTFQVESVSDPTNNFVFTQGHQFFVKSNSANYDGSTNDGYTGYVDDSSTPPTSSGSLVGTNVTVSSGTLTVSATGADSTFDFPGEYAIFSSCVSATFLNGQIVQIANASGSTITAVNTGFSDYGSTADNCTVKRQSSSNPVPFYSSGAAQWGGTLTSYDSETGGENPQAYSLTDFLAGAYGDGPEYGYGFHARIHDLVQVESAQFIADSDGGGQDNHSYAFKVGSPNQTPYWWVGLDGSSLSRQGFANVASVNVGSCNLSVGLNDCTASLIDETSGPPASETLTIKICATGTVYDTMDWTENGETPSCASQHMLRTETGTIVADGIQLTWGAQTGHTVGALAAIPITVNYGTQLRTTGGSYIYSTALPQPSSPIATAATIGVDTWSYCVVQKWNGIGTNCSTVGSTLSVGTLNSTDNITVSLNNGTSNPVIQCDLYRTVSGGTPSTTGVIASNIDCGSQVIDSGLAADSTTAPTTNLTGHTVIADGYLVTPPATQIHLPGITGTGCIGIASGVVSTTASGCSGSSGVTSVTIAGTTNQIGTAGTCTITSTGTCTLSIPTNPTLPGTTTGTFVGNITGNVTGNASGTAHAITGLLDVSNTPLTTTQDILYQNGSALGRLPISTVTNGQCLGNNSGTWSTFACSGGSGSGINITVNGGSALGGPANFQNGTSGNVVNFSNPSGSIVQATLQSNSITSGFLAPGLTLGGTTSGTFSGSLSGNASTATALAGSPTQCGAGNFATGIAASGNANCASAASGSLFASYQFASNTAITSTGNYFQLVPGVGLTSSYSGAGSFGSPYIATLTLANPSASTLGGVESFAAVSHQWIRQISTSGVPTASQPASNDLSDYGSIPNAALANTAVTFNGTTVALGASGSIPIQTNSVNNASMAGLNNVTSTTNAVGLTVTPTNSATNQVKYEVTGSTYTGTAAKASALASTPTQCSGNYASGIAANGNANCIGVANTTATYAGATVAANTCVLQTAITVSGLKTSAGINFTPTSDISAVNGWGSIGGMVWLAWPTANTVNWKVCNQTGSSIPAGGVTWNVSVVQQ